MKVWLKLSPDARLPESKGFAPAGNETLSALLALAGSAVTVWTSSEPFTNSTVSPDLIVMDAGSNLSWLPIFTVAAGSDAHRRLLLNSRMKVSRAFECFIAGSLLLVRFSEVPVHLH